MDQASAYCNCVADEVFGDGDISDETKNLMPTLSDKGSRIYQREDIKLVRGALMSCYIKNFYKKKWAAAFAGAVNVIPAKTFEMHRWRCLLLATPQFPTPAVKAM